MVETSISGDRQIHEPTILHDIMPAPPATAAPALSVADRQSAEMYLYEKALEPWCLKESEAHEKEVARVSKHVEISLNSLIDRQQNQLGEFLSRQIEGQTVQGLDGIISQAEEHLDKLTNRLDSRRTELSLERHCAISDINTLGRAWVVPHPGRATPQLAPMVRDDEIDHIAVQVAIQHEEARGWVVESGDYWLYAVFNCASSPDLHIVKAPARLGWQPVLAVEHYRIEASTIIGQKV